MALFFGLHENELYSIYTFSSQNYCFQIFEFGKVSHLIVIIIEKGVVPYQKNNSCLFFSI